MIGIAGLSIAFVLLFLVAIWAMELNKLNNSVEELGCQAIIEEYYEAYCKQNEINFSSLGWYNDTQSNQVQDPRNWPSTPTPGPTTTPKT